jgi:DNA-binding response OmpR family regulator
MGAGAADVAGAARVLVVEDDASFRWVLEEVLREAGYAVEAAPDGAAALAVVRRWPPDVILLDCNMPVLDGPGFLAAYRQEPGPRALLAPMSATADAEHWARQAGADVFLVKPFDLDAALALVRALVRRAARARDRLTPAPGTAVEAPADPRATGGTSP